MPVLGKRETKKIILPSSKEGDEAWVEMYTSIIIDDFIDAKQDDLVRSSLNAMVKVIKAWNFTDETGQIAPINEDTVRRLSMPDFKAIQEALEATIPTNMLDEAKKKVLSST